jgi:hypothetical protein
MAARKVKKAKKTKARKRTGKSKAGGRRTAARRGAASASKEVAALKAENRRLKARIAALEAAQRPESALDESDTPTHPMEF